MIADLWRRPSERTWGRGASGAPETRETPVLIWIQNGWLASENGWAFRGTSEQEALRTFEERLRWHEAVDSRPLPVESTAPD